MKTSRAAIAVMIGSAIALGVLAPARAQGVLKRLEQAIRDRKDEAGDARGAAADAAASRGAQPTSAAAAGGAREPGYLGAVADDRKDRGRGVRVIEVRPDGPAARAGLKPDDLIISAAGVRVRQMSDLADVLALFPPGATLSLEVNRGRNKQVLKVTLGQHPDLRPSAAASPGIGPPPPGQTPPPPPAEPSPDANPLPQIPRPPEKPLTGALPAVPAEPSLPGPQLLEPKPPVDGAAPQPTLLAEMQKRIEQLEQRNKELEDRIEKLERTLAEMAKKQ